MAAERKSTGEELLARRAENARVLHDKGQDWLSLSMELDRRKRELIPLETQVAALGHTVQTLICEQEHLDHLIEVRSSRSPNSSRSIRRESAESHG